MRIAITVFFVDIAGVAGEIGAALCCTEWHFHSLIEVFIP